MLRVCHCALGGNHHVPHRHFGVSLAVCFSDDLKHGRTAGHFHDQNGDALEFSGAEQLSEAINIELLVIKFWTAHHHLTTLDEILLNAWTGNSRAVSSNKQVAVF